MQNARFYRDQASHCYQAINNVLNCKVKIQNTLSDVTSIHGLLWRRVLEVSVNFYSSLTTTLSDLHAFFLAIVAEHSCEVQKQAVYQLQIPELTNQCLRVLSELHSVVCFTWIFWLKRYLVKRTKTQQFCKYHIHFKKLNC